MPNLPFLLLSSAEAPPQATLHLVHQILKEWEKPECSMLSQCPHTWKEVLECTDEPYPLERRLLQQQPADLEDP